MSKIIHVTTDDHDTRSFKDKEIDRWEIQYAGCIIIRSHYSSEEELDDAWEKFNQMPFDLQLVADDEALKLFGITNGKMYRRLKKVYLKKDIDNAEYIPLVYTPKDAIIESQGIDKNMNAYKYMRDTGYPMITDVDSLDELNRQWYRFCNIDKDIRTKSDGKSYDIYGMNNEEHYQSELSKLLRQDIEDTGYDEIDNVVGESSTLTYLVSSIDSILENSNVLIAANKAKNILLEFDNYSPVEKDITTYILTRFNASLREDVYPQGQINYHPFYKPDQLDILGTYNPSFSLKNSNRSYSIDKQEVLTNRLIPNEIWFNNYKAKFYGLKPNMIFSGYTDIINTLVNRFNNETDNDKKQVLKESIIGFGWNPYIEVTRENIDRVAKDNKEYIVNRSGYNFINISNSFLPRTFPVTSIRGIYVLFFHGYSGTEKDYPNTFIMPSTNINDTPSLIPIRGGYPYYKESFDNVANNYKMCSIYFVPIDEYLCDKIDKAFQYIIDNPVRFGYNFLNDLCIQLNTQCPQVENEKLFCTYLVNMIIQIANSNLASPGTTKILPLLSIYSKKHNVYKIFDDPVYKFLWSDILNRTRSIKNIEDITDKEEAQLESYDFIKALLYTDTINESDELILNEDDDIYDRDTIKLKDLEDMFMN